MQGICLCPLVHAELSLLHLGGGCQPLARPHGADSRLLLQLALRVLVGDSRGNTHPTAARAWGPVGGLDLTLLLSQVVPL